MNDNHYTIREVSPTQYHVFYHGDYIGEAPTYDSALIMRDQHEKRRDEDLPMFLVPQAC